MILVNFRIIISLGPQKTVVNWFGFGKVFKLLCFYFPTVANFGGNETDTVQCPTSMTLPKVANSNSESICDLISSLCGTLVPLLLPVCLLGFTLL